MTMNGKVCIVTGASSGIGRATAIALAKLGATVVPLVRDPAKSEATLTEISQNAVPPSSMKADLSSQASIREFAKEFSEEFDRLDVLVNNAGVFNSKRRLSADGVENTFAVNVLAPFLLTNLLLDMLISSAPSRIVNVSSDAANGSKIDFDNLQGERKYSTFGQYGQTKLALNLITVEFSRRLTGTRVTANFLHPGVIRTNLGRNFTSNPVAKALWYFVRLFMGSPEKGARTSVYLATSPDVEGVSGKYFANMKQADGPAASYDEENAKKLWKVCEELTGNKGAEQVAPQSSP